MRVYFFYKRNARNGEVLEDQIIDVDPHSAWLLYNQPRHFKYIGWSDGRFVKELRMAMPKDKERGDTPVQLSQEQKDKMLDAQAKELEFAKEHNDPPINDTMVDINGRPLRRGALYQGLREIQGKNLNG